MYIKVLVTKNRLENEYEKNKEDISEGLNKRLLTAGSTGTGWQAQAPIVSGYVPADCEMVPRGRARTPTLLPKQTPSWKQTVQSESVKHKSVP